ncbi:dTMP kinase [Novosphingobium sp. ZN18A2]|uniref:dTMP kinase n=1 Tax=Novosphingobium sp. ZN18A2 TaxID=3079861 RepID=UPI0030D3ACB0
MTGRFITFEGGEGAGKSTQARLLAAALKARGQDVVITREPGGTPGAEAIRELLLSTEGPGWRARAEALLFAAARSDHVETLIRPALQRGAWVVCDRFIDSSRAYQGGGSGLSDADILELHRIGSEELLPDRTVFLAVSPDEADRRLALRDGNSADRIGGRESDYHARVDKAFRTFAAQDPARFVEIEADAEPEAVHARIMSALAGLLPS